MELVKCSWQCWHCLTVNSWGPIEAGPPDEAGVSKTTHPVKRTCSKCGHPWRTRCKRIKEAQEVVRIKQRKKGGNK